MEGLSFKSSSASIATVSETGLVSGVKVGTANILVSKQGYKTIRVPVEVTEAAGVIAVSIEEIQGTGITTRTSQNLTSPYNYIIDEFPADAVGTLSFNVEAAGSYKMYMRCRASGGYSSTTTDDLASCMVLKLNNVKLDLSGTVSGNSFTDYLLGEVTLEAGEGSIEITCVSAVPTINLFRFIPNNA